MPAKKQAKYGSDFDFYLFGPMAGDPHAAYAQAECVVLHFDRTDQQVRVGPIVPLSDKAAAEEQAKRFSSMARVFFAEGQETLFRKKGQDGACLTLDASPILQNCLERLKTPTSLDSQLYRL